MELHTIPLFLLLVLVTKSFSFPASMSLTSLVPSSGFCLCPLIILTDSREYTWLLSTANWAQHFPQVCGTFWSCPKMVALFHFMSNYYMLSLVKRVWADSRREGYIFTFFWVLDTKREEKAWLWSTPVEWVPFSFGKTKHASVTGAYTSEGTAGVYLFSVFRKAKNLTLFLVRIHSLSSVLTEAAQRYISEHKPTSIRLLGTKQGVPVF